MARSNAREATRLRKVLASYAATLATQRDAYARGRAALLRGDGKAAARAFRSHLRRQAGSYSARVGLAVALATAGQRAAAERAFAGLGLLGDLGGLCELAWEVLGEEEVDVRAKAHALYEANELPRALLLAELAGARDLAAYTRAKLGQQRAALTEARRSAKSPKRGGLGAETAATLLIEGGEPESAARLFAELAKSDRSNWYDAGGDDRRTLGWSGLALIRFRAGEYTQALAAVKEVRAVRPAAEGALLLEVASLAALGLSERAKKALTAIERHHPLRELAWGGLRRSGLETLLVGRPHRRRAALEAANLAFAAGAAGDDAGPRQHLREAIAGYRVALGTRSPTCEEAKTGMLRWAVAHAWLGERAAAVSVASRLAAADRDESSVLGVIAWAGSGPRAARAYRAAGLGPQLYGGLAPTLRTLAAFRALPAREALSPVRRSLRGRAEQLIYNGMYAAALDVYDAVSLAPSEAARYLAAHAASELGGRARAWRFLAPYLAAHAETSYYQQPIDAWWLGERVAPVGKRRWVKETLESLWTNPEQRTPDRQVLAQRALHAKAFAAERRGRIEEALASYLAALEVRPSADVAGNAGNLLVHQGELERAEAWFAITRAWLGELAPPLRQGWQLAKLAWRALRGGQHATAATLAARAVELTQSPGDYHTLASARLGAGDAEGARAALALGLQLDPSHEELRALRAERSSQGAAARPAVQRGGKARSSSTGR